MIWIGRRPKDARIQQKLDKLAEPGPSPVYICADATKEAALESAYQRIRDQYGDIHGVIHSAIVLKDQSLSKMNEESFRAGLCAKVDTSVNMVKIFGRAPLDFILFFSSIISFGRAAGQSNYAAGSTFKDAYAIKLAQESPFAVKIMNWGYWGSVGIVSSTRYQERMQRHGLASIEPAEGMAALDRLMQSPINQMALIKTLNPDALEGIKSDERVAGYGGRIPSIIDSLGQSLSGRAKPIPVRRNEDDLEFRKMEDLLCRILHGQLWSMGVFSREKFTLGEIKEKIAWIDLYDRWFEASMAFLQGADLLQSHDGAGADMVHADPVHTDPVHADLVHADLVHADTVYTVTDTGKPSMEALWQEWEAGKAVWVKDRHLKSLTLLVERVMQALPEILTGRVPATAVLFPDASLELVEDMYKGTPVTDYFNDVIADSVVEYLKLRLAKDPETRLRILEIGAGTGGTTARVLSALSPFRKNVEAYCYTDISQAFLMHADKTFAPDHPFLRTALFDVEKPPGEQNIPKDAYDLVIAVDVLHATRNIRKTLGNAKAVLARHGLLLLNEMSLNPLSGHLTFGLLKGWWLAEDRHLRIPGSPALSPQMWHRALAGEGFTGIFFPVEKAHGLGHQIIIAESDGIVRQQSSREEFAEEEKRLWEVEITPRDAQGENGDEVLRKNRDELLRKKVTAYIKKLVGETLKIPLQRIKASTPFEKYGVDSILVVRLTNAMGKVLDNINSTLFFEYQTIDALVTHFMSTRKKELMGLVGQEKGAADEGPFLQEPAVSRSEAISQAIGFSVKERFLPAAPLEEGLPKEAPPEDTLPKEALPEEVLPKDTLSEEAPPKEALPKSKGLFDVAIIGLAGRYAGSKNVEAFWQNLKQGRNCITRIPRDRWDWEKYYHGKRGKKGFMYTKWGGFMADIDRFDPLFFQISPREAELMDPQERLFLETAWHSIEDAGYTPDSLCNGGSENSSSRRRVGVFAGVMNTTYARGPAYASIANRASYLFNFQGPSMAVDTACSSSLTAIHLALESLYSGTSECAVAGGVNLIVDPSHFLRLSAMNLLSPGDRCCSFGRDADGIVDGEGVGAVVLKPLARAVADRDHIYGVIKGSLVNAGGKTNGYTVPNPWAQAELILETLERSGVDARTISFVEAHGTGTVLGDPIEIAGLTHAFEKKTQEKQFCAVGSAKSNIGHCEGAAGIAGLTKVLLQLKHGLLAPSLHSEEINPNIDFSVTPFFVNQNLSPWNPPLIQGRTCPRRAGISSFGAGGSNAHIIVEEYIPPANREPVAGDKPGQNLDRMVVLSAGNADRLRARARELADFLETAHLPESPLSLLRMVYTLQVGRVAMAYRLGFTASSVEEVREKLAEFLLIRDFEKKRAKEGLIWGRSDPDDEVTAAFQEDEVMDEILEKWVRQGKLTRLLGLWVRGVDFDWNRLYKEEKPQRMSLPVYPFERKRYWRRDDAQVSAVREKRGLHPLVHENISTFHEQCFRTVFTGQEFFLRDHQVKGQKVLPAVACLEMARAAVEQSLGYSGPGYSGGGEPAPVNGETSSMIGLRNVVWMRPLAVEDTAVKVRTALLSQVDGNGEPGDLWYEIQRENPWGQQGR